VPKPAQTRKPAPAARPARVDSARLEAALLRTHSHAPLARVLSRRSGNPYIADRAAAAVLAEARRLRLSPSLVAAVLLVENTPLDTTALSVAGAVGLMQVMPVHGGAMGCPSAELREVESNICHGARVLKMYVRRTRTLRMALRRYNGCVGTLTTRRCLRYPARVLRTASSVRREMLAAPVPAVPPTSPPPPAYLAVRPPVQTSLSLSTLLIGRLLR
jgi:soluble lytic murein transglycosylase-like protein